MNTNETTKLISAMHANHSELSRLYTMSSYKGRAFTPEDSPLLPFHEVEPVARSMRSASPNRMSWFLEDWKKSGGELMQVEVAKVRGPATPPELVGRFIAATTAKFAVSGGGIRRQESTVYPTVQIGFLMDGRHPVHTGASLSFGHIHAPAAPGLLSPEHPVTFWYASRQNGAEAFARRRLSPAVQDALSVLVACHTILSSLKR